jgi:hypothetical protein
VVLNNCAARCISLSTLGQREGGYSSLLRPSRGNVPCLRTLVTNLSPRRPGFDPKIFNVEFVFDTQALTQVAVRVFQVFLVSVMSVLVYICRTVRDLTPFVQPLAIVTTLTELS